MKAHALFERRFEKAAVVIASGGVCLILQIRMVGEFVQCPGQRGCGGLMPRQQQGDELVA